MKLVHHRADTPLTLTGHGPGFVLIDQVKYTESLVLGPERLQPGWAPHLELLEERHFTELLDHDPELVLLGSGNRFRFPDWQLTRPLLERGIGLEVMDTAAACRTYAILSGEGRRVVAALIIEPASWNPSSCPHRTPAG
ncbi:Mth938-like domain-containing protein [Ferrovum sp.]|jgi:uncharacterized protein|uniref:Mth938-like domain-containing protein n=1 Tax=Ferrovum sp. TaxID=2609467 RepID=UPI00262FF1F6|nr:Mth938-like domain-containing protein [Ferrovum sp.]